jgi:hypothetical protein
MSDFVEVQPSLVNYWRAIILFGRNVASYKFALGKTLLEMARARKTFVPLTDHALHRKPLTGSSFGSWWRRSR